MRSCVSMFVLSDELISQCGVVRLARRMFGRLPRVTIGLHFQKEKAQVLIIREVVDFNFELFLLNELLSFQRND